MVEPKIISCGQIQVWLLVSYAQVPKPVGNIYVMKNLVLNSKKMIYFGSFFMIFHGFMKSSQLWMNIASEVYWIRKFWDQFRTTCVNMYRLSTLDYHEYQTYLKYLIFLTVENCYTFFKFELKNNCGSKK